MQKFALIIIISLNIICFGQISIESIPKSYSVQNTLNITIERLPEFDVQAFLDEDERNASEIKPYRFANPIEVDFNMENSGTWTVLDDGSKIWQLIIHSPNAYSLNVIYDVFQIPNGAEFFVYSEDREMVLGAFTYFNHKPHGGFSTAPVKGEMIVFEYNEPLNPEFYGQISISTVAHDYRGMFFSERGYGDSGSCNNNVACSVGDDWNDEIRSVAMILTSGGSRLCTGSLVNNTRQDLTPYFLTANHCLGGNNSWIFMFNYESPTCTNQNGPTNMTVSGSSLLASNSSSDFALLELNENPPESYNVHYAGWDATGNIPATPVGIHHPSGDIKKISFDYDNASNSGNYWDIDSWDDGTTEPGSSGSPLFEGSTQRIIGQLYGGVASCTNFGYDTYGKVSSSWNSGMSNYLDPDNTGQNYIDGMDAIDLPDPVANLNIGNLEFELENGQSASTTLQVFNDGEAESVLTYSMKITPFSTPGGQPDSDGYWWTDSELDNHINTDWIDISANAIPISFPHNDQAGNAINIGFDFPFYGENYSELIVNANGWIGFGDDNSSWQNTDIPSTSAPLPAIFPFWDDLNPVNDSCNNDCSGNVYYASYPDKFVVWFNNVSHWVGTDYPGTSYNFQIILYSDGRINFHYDTITGNFSPTIGMQNADGTVGQKIMLEETAVNTGWVSSGKSLLFSKAPEWVGINSLGNHEESGEIEEGNSHSYDIAVENTNLASGEHSTFLNFTSNGGQAQSYSISLTSSEDVGMIGDLNMDEELNVLDIVQLVNVILNGTNDNYLLWAGDINGDENLNVLDIVQLVNLILNF